MSDAVIRAALEVQAKNWAAAQSPAIPVFYENQPGDRPSGRYAEVFMLSGPTESETLDRVHRSHIGVFQVSLHMPKGTGTKEGEDLAASLDPAFPTTAPIVRAGVSVYITSPMSKRTAVPGDTHYSIPVSCNYRADTVT